MVKRFLLILLFFSLISSCAHFISPEMRTKVDSSLSFSQVLQNPNAYKDKIVLRGGEIIQIVPQDGATIIEVLQMPLGWRGKPADTSTSEGKILVLIKEYLDLSLLKKGMKITVAGEVQGEILGEKIKSVSETDYRYPLLLSKQTHLWKEYYYPYSSSPPYYPDPHRYDPFERGLRF